MTGHPRRIHVRRVNEVAAGGRVSVQHVKRLTLVRGPGKDVAAKAEREDVDVGVVDSRHGRGSVSETTANVKLSGPCSWQLGSRGRGRLDVDDGVGDLRIA